MRLDWLRAVADRAGPFATVLLDTTHDTEDASRLDALRWRALRSELADQGAPEAALRVLDEAVARTPPPDGAAGTVLVADSGSVLVEARSARPPDPPRARWDDLPDLMSVVQNVDDPVRAVVVSIDETGGAILVPGRGGGATGDPARGPAGGPGGEDVIERVGSDDGPVHKVRGGGWSHLAMQERVEETWRRNTAEVAARVDTCVAATGARLLVLAGDARSRARLRDALPQRSASIAVEVEHSGGADPADLADTVAEAAEGVSGATRQAALDRFAAADGRAEGLAVEGIPDVAAALRERAVETLIVDPGRTSGEVRLWSGPDPTVLAAQREDLVAMGLDSHGPFDAAAALLRAAVLTDADLVVVGEGDELAGPLLDGVGAVLRHPVASAGRAPR